jgi:glycosyltransferase involved in cell wall biosynthesis
MELRQDDITGAMKLYTVIGQESSASLLSNPRWPSKKPRLLAIVNIDSMVWVLLRPWLTGLQEAGYEVHIACSPGQHFERLEALGFEMHAVSMRRTFRPWAHVRPFFELVKVIHRGGFSIVNTHSAVASAIGRFAAWVGGCNVLVYTVHGFYFHDKMGTVRRSLFVSAEWLLGKITKFFMFVSDEDHQTAIRMGIASARSKSITIFNGVDIGTFCPREMQPVNTRRLKIELRIPEAVPVVGIVARIVREKGYREFLEMAGYLLQKREVIFLVVGDTLPSDRCQFGAAFKEEVAEAGLMSQFRFTGQTDRVADYLRIMDIFTLPSYREGFPCSILEAMSTGLPVVATDIRGCREAVVHGKNGLIVPPKDSVALARAIERLLAHPEEAAGMGRAGRRRAVELYDCRIVRQRFVDFIDEVRRDTHHIGAF